MWQYTRVVGIVPKVVGMVPRVVGMVPSMVGIVPAEYIYMVVSTGGAAQKPDIAVLPEVFLVCRS